MCWLSPMDHKPAIEDKNLRGCTGPVAYANAGFRSAQIATSKHPSPDSFRQQQTQSGHSCVVRHRQVLRTKWPSNNLNSWSESRQVAVLRRVRPLAGVGLRAFATPNRRTAAVPASGPSPNPPRAHQPRNCHRS